jgi:hypothetical protein
MSAGRSSGDIWSPNGAAAVQAAAPTTLPLGALSLEALRQTVREAGPQGLDPSVLRLAREQGEARLLRDRENLAPRRAAAGPASPQAVSMTAPGLARKAELLPLPQRPAAAPVNPRRRDIERLTQAVEQAAEGVDRDRLQLDLAAAYVGGGMRDQARAVYQQIVRRSANPGIRATAALNLNILAGQAPAAASPPEGNRKTASSTKSSNGGIRP